MRWRRRCPSSEPSSEPEQQEVCPCSLQGLNTVTQIAVARFVQIRSRDRAMVLLEGNSGRDGEEGHPDSTEVG